MHDSYLILRHGSKARTDIVEYRTDAKGGNFEQAVIKKGYIVTSGFALDCNYFATGFQDESVFRYLGEQRLDGRETSVVGFAQKPGIGHTFGPDEGTKRQPGAHPGTGHRVDRQEQFPDVRMRTDLLAPRWDVGLNQQTTEVTLSKVQLADVAAPLWLPST